MRPSRARRVATAAVLALAAAALAGRAAAADATDAVVLAARSAEPRGPDVAVAPSGRAVAAWTQRSGDGFAVVARVRTGRAAGWAPADRVSGVTATRPLGPVVAMADDGRAVAVWRAPGGAVRSASLGATARRGWAAAPVASGPGEGFAAATVAIGSGGATAAWADRLDGRWRVHRAVRPARGAPWAADPPLDLVAAGVAPAGAALPPAIGASGRGRVAVVWPARTPVPGRGGEVGPGGPAVLAPPGRVAATVHRGAAGWEPAAELSATGGQADLAVSGRGEVAVVWVQDGNALQAAVRGAAADGWPAPEALAGPEAGAPAPSLPQVAVNDEGYALVAWASGADGPGGLSVRARVRSGASGLWDRERVVYDGFAFFSVLDLATLEAAIDEQRVGHLAWLDPEGPGSATVHAASGGLAGWRSAARVSVMEDLNEPAMAVSARGGGVLATPGAEAVGGPNIRMLAAGFPRPPRFTATRAQLVVNQRISQAAVRRVNAALERLDGRVGPAHIRGGTLPAAAFGDGVRVEGAPTGEPAPALAIEPLAVARPGARAPGGVRWSASQLRINQRVSQAAVARAAFGRQLVELGLTGANVADGAIGRRHLLPGLRIAAAVPVATPLPESPVLRRPVRRAARVQLTAEQLRINQRISQAAVLRANWLVERLEGGLRGEDFRAGGLRAEDLEPAAPGG
ncbi:hypothetical protein [Miltoncostaea marina]|uniref:hypothetical protein n=1 Tax=Miltoncostaea marina TaxID=2843215 RepID=UPI001C3DC2F7|nr:hypothetical protein [Miltoncostaea marina]